MKRKTTEALPVSDSDLDQPPHVVPRLIDLVMNAWQPTVSQYEQLLTHLSECIYCQIALRTLVKAIVEHDSTRGYSPEPAQQLLSQLTDIIHETKVRNQLGAYIEMLDTKGKKTANKRFPAFADHLTRCKECRLAVEETRDLLRRAEQAGLIAPLQDEAHYSGESGV